VLSRTVSAQVANGAAPIEEEANLRRPIGLIMTDKLARLALFAVVALLSNNRALRAQGREIAVLERANTALNEFEAMPLNWVPIHRLMMAQVRKAQGVAIFPGMFKAAAGIGGRHGRGVLLIRETDGSWGPPMFVKLSGANVGIQLGIGSSDMVLVFRTRSTLEQLKKGKLILGVDNMLAVGPIGVDHGLGTDPGLTTCVLSPACLSRGLYAGWSVEGNRLQIDAAATAAYEQYERNYLRNSGPMGTRTLLSSLRLQMRLAELSATPTVP
jgi:lipid-binding SYLF domain-containing protein